jgi:polyisoprenoid-binding protein YceI
MKSLFLFIAIIITPVMLLSTTPTSWKLDKTHSSVRFSVSHLVISEVEGTFGKFDASVFTHSDDFVNSEIEFTIEVNSINTENEKRDEHLKSDDFFSAQKFPEIKFTSTSMKKIGDKKFKLAGNLTLHGVTKPIELDVKLGGVITAWGGEHAGFKITGNINRFDFGLAADNKLDTGDLIVGDIVNFTVNIEIVKEKAATEKK